MAFFVDDGRDDHEVRCFDRVAKLAEECCTGLGDAQNTEIPLLLPNLVAMQHNAVMAPKSELEPLERRHDAVDIREFAHHAEDQHKHRELRIDRRKAVIPAFIRVNDIIAEGHKALFQK
jgi:hypothetical protein